MEYNFIDFAWEFVTLLWTLEWRARAWKAVRSLELPLMHEKHTSLAHSSKPAATWMPLQPFGLAMWGCKWWTDTLDSFYGHPARDLDQLGSTWIPDDHDEAMLQGQHDRPGWGASFQCWCRWPPDGWCRCRGMIFAEDVDHSMNQISES